MDNKRRLLIAQQANPSIRVAAAPQQQTISTVQPTVQPRITSVGGVVQQPRLFVGGKEVQVDPNAQTQAQQPVQKPSSLAARAAAFGKGLGIGLVKAPIQFVNQAFGEGKESVDTARGMIAQATHNDQAYANAQQNYENTLKNNFGEHAGLFGLGTFTNTAETRKGDLATGARKIGAGTAQTALSVLPFAKGIGIGAAGVEGAAAAGNASRGYQIATTAARAAGEGAAYGGANAAAEQIKEGHFDAKGLAVGAGEGSLFGLGGAALGAGGKLTTNKLKATNKTVPIDKDILAYLKHEKDPTAVHELLSSLGGGGTSPELAEAATKIAGTSSAKTIRNLLLDLPQEAAAGGVAAAIARDALQGGERELQREGSNALNNANQPTSQPINLGRTGDEVVDLELGNIANGSVPEGTPGSRPATGDMSIADLSKQAKNSFENAPEGVKPGGIDRAAGEIDNGSAKPIRYRTTPEGDTVIEDGRHRLEAARAAGIHDFPVEDVTSKYGTEAQQIADSAKAPEVAKLESGQPLTEADLIAADNALSGSSSAAPAEVPQTNAVASNADAATTTTGTTTASDAIDPNAPITGLAQQQVVSRQAAQAFTPEERAALIDAGENPETLARGAGFAQSVRESRNVSDPVKGKVAAAYDPITNPELQDSAEQLIQSGLENAQNSVAASLNKADGAITAQDTADAIALAKYYDNIGGDANWDTSSQIYDRLAAHLTAAGQTIQAASLLNNLSPEGLMFRAQRTLTRADVNITPEIRGKLTDALDDVRNTTPNSEAHNYAVQVFRKTVADSLPSTVGEKAVAIWKAGLLTGLRTQTGNILSNGTFAALHELSNPGAVLLDKLIALKTGERGKSLTTKGQFEGVIDGIKHAGRYVKSGVDERDAISNKFETGEINFKNPVINGYVNGIFRIMGAADRPFYYRQLANSFYDMAKADGLTKGLKGDALKTHVNDFITNADNDTFNKVFNTATLEAQKSVLANDTFLGRLAGKANKAADEIENPLGRQIVKAAVNVAIPFSKVPSAFITRVLDFTPYGALKEVGKQLSTRTLDQRALATALSEATTGTALVWLGSQLADNNLLSGQYPTDAHEQARWKAEGITPNSVKVGNKWLSLNYFGPVGSLFSMGKRITDTQKEGGSFSDVASAVTGGTVQDALGQSFLQGVSGILDAVNDPKRYAKSFVNSEAGSIVPTIVNDISTATDSVGRQTNNAFDAIKNRTPFRHDSLPAIDTFGNEVTARTDPANSIVNPFRPSDEHTNALYQEIDRLHNVDVNNSDYQVTPEAIDKTLKAAGGTTKLTPQQRTDLQISAGHSAQLAMTAVMQSDAYAHASDDQKAKMLKDASSDAISVAKDDFEQKNTLGQYAAGYTGKKTNLTQAQKQIADGNIDNYVTSVANKQGGLDDSTAKLDNYSKAYYSGVNGKSAQDLKTYLAAEPDTNSKNLADKLNKELPNGLQINPSNQITKLYADYQKAKANGDWSKIEEQQKLDTFQASVVKTDKPQLTQDLFDAGGSHAQTYLNEGYVTKDDLDDAVDLDNKLYSAGLEGSLKFSKKFRKTYGYGNPPEPTKDTSKSSASSSGSNKAAKEISTNPGAIGLHFNPGSSNGGSAISNAKTTFSAPSRGSGNGVVVPGVPSDRTSIASQSFTLRAPSRKAQAIKLK